MSKNYQKLLKSLGIIALGALLVAAILYFSGNKINARLRKSYFVRFITFFFQRLKILGWVVEIGLSKKKTIFSLGC